MYTCRCVSEKFARFQLDASREHTVIISQIRKRAVIVNANLLLATQVQCDVGPIQQRTTARRIAVGQLISRLNRLDLDRNTEHAYLATVSNKYGGMLFCNENDRVIVRRRE